MPGSAILFGAIGALTETSDMQRRAFNAAFAEAGLSWHWDWDSYVAMLAAPGGQDRIADYAATRGDDVDAAALHAAKVQHFRTMAHETRLQPRPGVVATIQEAREAGRPVGFVTATGADTVALILDALQGVDASDFAYIGEAGHVSRGKPAPDIYLHALSELGVTADQALAIEDTPESAQAAVAAGIPTLGFPGDAARGRAFPAGVEVVEALPSGLLPWRATL